ncbi:MAG: response regulator [Geminicoccaceae bacterium]|nr:response regulator [Geminicoccaceae bacterium]
MHGSADTPTPDSERGGDAVRILVVDHSAFFRHFLQPLLQGAGFDVVAVGSAQAALDLRSRGERFDVIISDIDLPGMDGHALARACRSGGPWQHVPLIALTTRRGPDDVAQGSAAGFSHQITKLDGEAVLVAVQQATGMSW